MHAVSSGAAQRREQQAPSATPACAKEAHERAKMRREHAVSSSGGICGAAARREVSITPLASRSYPSGRVPADSHQRARKRRWFVGRRRGQRRCSIPKQRGICVRGPDELTACIRAPRFARCTSFALPA
jgi:hypothetical protein